MPEGKLPALSKYIDDVSNKNRHALTGSIYKKNTKKKEKDRKFELEIASN